MPRLRIPESFDRTLHSKPAAQQGQILKAVRLLGENPRHPGLRTHRVQGVKGVWEARCSQGDRLTFEYGDDCIILRVHCNHDEVLRRP